MKVLHINSYYNTDVFYKNLFDKQIINGLKITVFVPVLKNDDRKISSDIYTIRSLNHNKFDKFTYIIKHIKIYNDLINKLDVFKFDVIHAHSLFSNGYIAYKLKKNYNIPYIVAVRNGDLNIFFKKVFFLRPLGFKILLNASKIIFLSDSYKNQYLNKYVPKEFANQIKRKSIVIPNGVNDFWITNRGLPKKKSYIKGKSYIKLLYIGDINKNKNLGSTIKAAKILQEKGHLIKLTVIGKIKRKRYKKMLDQEFIKYYNYMDNRKLLRFYRENDIFIMPSKYETFGIVYLEAISQCTPIIYTKNQGFDSYGNNYKLGVNVVYNDINAITDSILEIMYNYNYYSSNCYNKIKKFSWDNIKNDYNEIYKEVNKKHITLEI